MPVEVNAVWQFSSATGLEEGSYRILGIFPEINRFVIFNIRKSQNILRPLLIAVDEFSHFKQKKLINCLKEIVAPHTLQDQSKLSDSSLKIFQKRWELIADLVQDKELLLSLASLKKQPKIIYHGKKTKTHTKTIYKYLNLYWRYGQTPSALFPEFHACGAKGKQKEKVSFSLGRKYVSLTGAFPERNSFIINMDEKNNIKKAVKKYHLKPNGASISQTYREYLRQYFGVELTDASLEKRIPSVPSIRQFRYWVDRLFDKHQLIEMTKYETDYLTNYRDNQSSIVSDYEVPGACFEIDATVIDVHIVSKWNRNKVLGRPTLYFVVDRASGMTVGFSLSLFFESWDAARLAIYNAFIEKVEYCRINGVDISNQDWPCCYIPNRLVADNAEMLGLNAEEAVIPMVPLEFAPVSRPDFKPFVEGKFNTLNKEVVHNLQGATKNKDKIVRAAPDPRSRAIYTIDELRTIILRSIIDKNSQNQRSLAYRSKLLVQTDSEISPLGFWRMHVEHYMCALKKASPEEVEARLLRSVKASITKNGIFYEQMYYSHEKLIASNLAAIAKSNGRIELEGRVNDDCLDHIYVKFPGEYTFTRCSLLPRSKELSGLSIADIYFIQDWVSDKDARKPISISSIESQAINNAITRHAKNELKKAPKLRTKKARVEHKRENRLLEMAKTLTEEQTEEPSENAQCRDQNTKKPRSYSNNVVTLPGRGKSDEPSRKN